MAEKYYIGKAHWSSILKSWMEMYSILAPQKTDKNGLFLEIVTPDNQSSIVYDQARAANPMKTFLLPPIDEVVGDPLADRLVHQPLS